jgi:hypothetical protein
MTARRILLATIGLLVMATASVPAMADHDDWRRHHDHDHDWHGYRGPGPGYYAPPVVVAPAPYGYYAPPPVYYNPGVTFGLTIR